MEPELKNIATHSFTLRELSAVAGVQIKGDPELRVSGIGPLESASSEQISFLTDRRLRHLVAGCKAAALIVSAEFADLNFNLLVAENPYLALAKIAALFTRAGGSELKIHPSAIIAGGVDIQGEVGVGPYASIGDDCRVGARTRIGGGCHIGRGVRIGEDCQIYPRVVILDGCILGNRVIIHSGAVIGTDGFGFAQDELGRHFKIPQTGIVQIDDDVEIGANTTVDRATFGRTWIKRGAKIDNLVMIAHNVVVGEDSAFAAQVGISGSTIVGDRVLMGGQVGVSGHLEIGVGARLSAKSGVLGNVKPGQVVGGSPAVPHIEWLRNVANVRRLSNLKEELKRLREKVQRIEEVLKQDDGNKRD